MGIFIQNSLKIIKVVFPIYGVPFPVLSYEGNHSMWRWSVRLCMGSYCNGKGRPTPSPFCSWLQIEVICRKPGKLYYFVGRNHLPLFHGGRRRRTCPPTASDVSRSADRRPPLSRFYIGKTAHDGTAFFCLFPCLLPRRVIGIISEVAFWTAVTVNDLNAPVSFHGSSS